jgi:hypothetical protein
MLLAFVVSPALAAGPPPQGGTPPPPGDVPPVGQNDLDDVPALDLANLPVPEGAKFAMDLSTEKRDKAHELALSLTDEQRASIAQLLADNPLPGVDNVADPGQAGQSAEELKQGAEALKASLFAMNRWRDTISSRMAGILTPEQYALYQDSLLPAPVQMEGMEPRSATDCYYAYYYGYYYANVYAYYFYVYAYYTYSTCSDPYAYLVYDLAYNSYMYSYYGYVYSYYAYVGYYDATYAYYAGYFMRHAEGFAYYGYEMAYILDSWCGSSYSYYAYLYGYYAYYYVDIADYYAWSCYYDVPTGDKYAVIVGIADFLYGSDLNYTDDDANDFYNILVNRGGFSSANINKMIDSQATKSNIQSAITSWLDSREDADDLVVIFYSAHGSNGTDQSPIDESDGLDEYLVAHDSYSYGTMIRDEEFDGWLDNLESNNVVVIVDVCFSGGLISASPEGDGAVRYYPMPGEEVPGMAGQGPSAASVQPGDGFARDVDQSGRIVMTASAEDELSWETSTLQNGVFSYYLVDGLDSSSADTSSNGWVSAEEAFSYLNPLVQSYTGNQQNPQMYDGISGAVDLTQPSSSVSARQSAGYLPVGVGEPSGQDQPGDRGGLPLGQSVDLSSLPVPEELAETGFAMPLDSQKAQMSAELVRSLTAEQQAQVGALVESNRSEALDRAVAKLAQAGKEPVQDLEAMEAAVAEVKGWQEAMSAGMAGILTPEQYALYQDSLLPAPVQMEGMEPRSATDCYYAFLYGYYYANVYAYYYYVYAYYTYVGCGDPYVWDSYLFGYNSYMYSYYGYIYSYYAYVYYPDSTYQFYSYYFTRHAEGFTYWGYNFAYITYTWCGCSNSYYAYLYGYYAYYYTDIMDSYAWYCYAGSSPALSEQGDQSPGGASDETRPDASWGNPEYSLTVDRDTVNAGECVTLKWHAKYVREAYLNGEGLVGESGGRKDCLYTDKDYVFRVVLADGSTRDVIRTVTVAGQ